jgi:hypothetical protein
MENGGVNGARGVLINITGSSHLSLHDVNAACSLIRGATANEHAQINFGLVLNEAMEDEVKITVIATGFQREGLPHLTRKSEPIPEPAPAPVQSLFEIPARGGSADCRGAANTGERHRCAGVSAAGSSAVSVVVGRGLARRLARYCAQRAGPGGPARTRRSALHRQQNRRDGGVALAQDSDAIDAAYPRKADAFPRLSLVLDDRNADDFRLVSRH